jgi:2-polyprenyl-3-methyl-5-hydroxy-6-metoxy-1,4-benzoquinol methylase
MNIQVASTTDFDSEWEKWGALDPYFGVLTASSFRRENLTPESREAFFRTGELHVESVLLSASRALGRRFSPKSILDYGCGVGRLVIPFATRCQRVVGADVAQSMLSEAARNCESLGARNVELKRVEDDLRNLNEKFELVHSFIVFQHIPPPRGLAILRLLLAKVASDGCAAIHVTYGKNYGSHDFGAPEPVRQVESRRSLRSTASEAKTKLLEGLRWQAPNPAKAPEAGGDPLMPMFIYDLGKVMYVFQEAGFSNVDLSLVDHAGELGAMLYGVRARQ